MGRIVVDSPKCYNGLQAGIPAVKIEANSMKITQLPLFLRRTFQKKPSTQILNPVTPTGESSLMQTLVAFQAYLAEKYAPKTAKMYWGDVRELSIYLKNKKLKEITSHDLQQWVGSLVSPAGKGIERKTVNRKVSAIITYFLWLQGIGAITADPTTVLNNTRIQSPLPDYLYENEIEILSKEASADPRSYLLVLLFLDTGLKSNELFLLTKADVDISDPYTPELWIKHSGKQAKKDRKVALPARFTAVYNQYLERYPVEDKLFPFTDRFMQMIFADLKRKTGIEKELTPKTLRHTHVVRAYKRGEDFEIIFDRIGLAPDSRPEAAEMYKRLAGRGI
jgi:site-specific recombinase XerD